MRTTVARKRLHHLRSEAEHLDWSEGVEALKRAEEAVTSGGVLTGWSCTHRQTRSFIVEVATNMTDWYKKLIDEEHVFDNQNAQISRMRSKLEHNNPQRLANKLHTHATNGAYNDERQTFLSLSHKLTNQLASADKILDNTTTVTTQFQESKETILDAIQQSLELIDELINAATFDAMATKPQSDVT